ncbi:glycosyltransferase [Agromyces sp. NPDC056523]|uniref:glycosyltransferase n=1 Tax=Agromyces sp. NPDC056523 TaxID=3345850 RepID=UPI00366FC423
MKILHVTECLATGVLDVIARMSSKLSAEGCDVTVLHVPHPESPSASELRHALPGIRIVTGWGSGRARPLRVMGLALAMTKLLREDWDIVHLHSTFAGFVGRVRPSSIPIVYSPHGFSFLRHDVAPRAAALFKFVERRLARRADVIHCVSRDEHRVAAEQLRARPILLQNVLDSGSRWSAETIHRPSRPPRVVNLGRWSQQKAPERFVRAASELHDVAEFRWIGTGEADVSGRWTVSGWLDQQALADELASASLVYFTSRWEGMPVGLMQAQAAGIPAIAIDCVGVADVVVDGITGHIARNEDEALSVLRRLLGSPSELNALSASSRAGSGRFADVYYGRELLEVYRVAANAKS